MSMFNAIPTRAPMLRYEMTMTDFEILVFIFERGSRTAVELSELLSVAPKAVAVYMNRLRVRGYVDSERKKSAHYYLTEKGEGVILELRKRIANG